MKTPLTLITLVAAAALAGCDTSPETITGGPADPDAAEIANEVANVQLPPSIVASHKYRCGDNSILAVDWMSDGTTNSARVTPAGGETVTVTQVPVAAPVAGEEVAGSDYTAEGATLKGAPTETSLSFNGKSCKR